MLCTEQAQDGITRKEDQEKPSRLHTIFCSKISHFYNDGRHSRPNQGLQPLHQGGEGGRIEGGDGHGVETSAEGCQKRPVRNAIPLVEDPKGRLASQVEILEDLLDGGDLRLKGRVAHVDHMEEDVRPLEFVKRRPEGGRRVPSAGPG